MTQISSSDGVLDTTLTIGVARWDTGVASFNTRCWNGAVPGPVLRVKPGDTMAVRLVNELEGDTFETVMTSQGMNQYTSGNFSNLHTHGLHVSSEGNADNVFVHVDPGDSFHYQIPIPANHGPGLHWAHAHVHMATNLQVQNGMLGAIIVEDDPETTPAELAAMREEVVVLQHVILDESQTDVPQASRLVAEVVSNSNFDLGLETTATTPGSFYTANGVHMPTLSTAPSELVRVRMVHAGHRHFLNTAIDGCDMYLLAKDGLYLDAPRLVSTVSMVPGSRRDVALRCSAAGTYQMTSVDDAGLGNNVFVGPLLTVDVSGAAMAMSLPESLPPRPDYAPDLRNAVPDSSYSVAFGGGGTYINTTLVAQLLGVIGAVLVLHLLARVSVCSRCVSPGSVLFAGLRWTRCRCACCGHTRLARRSSKVSAASVDLVVGRAFEIESTADGDIIKIPSAAQMDLNADEEDDAAASSSSAAPGPRVPVPFCNWVSMVVLVGAMGAFVAAHPSYEWGYGTFGVNGQAFEGPDSPIATVGQDEVVEVTIRGGGGGGGLMHPYHQHIYPAQIVSIPGGQTEVGGFRVGDWYDVMPPVGGGNGGGGGGVRGAAADEFTIRYLTKDFGDCSMVTHCHILAHEDVGMMATVAVTGA